MRTGKLALLLSLIFGLSITILDAIMDAIFFYDGNILESIIFNVPVPELFFRILIVSICVVFGIALSFLIEKKEQYIIESEKKFRFLYENLPLPYQTLDEHCIIQEVNATWLQHLGYERNEVIGKSFSEILPDSEKSTFRTHFKEVWRDGQVYGRHIHLLKRDGTIIQASFDCSLSSLERSDEKVTHCVFRDMTERFAIEQQLKDAEMRADFLRDLMFHDLNNIHQGILLSLELLSRYELKSDATRLVMNTLEQMERASNLLLNVRKFIRVDSEKLHFKRIDILSILRDAIESAEARFPNKEVELKLVVNPGTYKVNADISLVDVFYNIFHNVIRLDNKTPVKIDIIVEKADGTGEIFVEVNHYGPGIPDEQKETLFKRFELIDNMGFGLGLTLAKRILDRHGASIEVGDRVKGNPSQGASFIIRIPTPE
ncbi:MAG: hypothetical protein BAJATHORv1_80061 [Candidatus Thorarchaeota archaeon]|nr:MAG: hypothetical protein BAJATHORv1_80061 [Candidatus Thorarchaeota archaeon]